MHNPQIVVDNVLAPKPLTLGQFALLERIRSPFLGEVKQYAFYEMLPSLYLLSMPPAEALQHLDSLDADALQWADAIDAATIVARIQETNEAVDAFFKAIPKKGSDKESAKKASPAMASC